MKGGGLGHMTQTGLVLLLGIDVDAHFDFGMGFVDGNVAFG